MANKGLNIKFPALSHEICTCFEDNVSRMELNLPVNTLT